jgi:hypothetical protein
MRWIFTKWARECIGPSLSIILKSPLHLPRSSNTRIATLQAPRVLVFSLLPPGIVLLNYSFHWVVFVLKLQHFIVGPMFSIRSILQVVFAAVSTSTGGSPRIQWGLCNTTEVNSTAPIVCGNLAVPLDYTEPSSNSTLTLQLLKVPAILQPSKGSILFNFGGPGAPGRESLGLLGPALLA